jgi:MFS family permease
MLALFTDSMVYSLIVPILPHYLGEQAAQAAIGTLFFAYAAGLLVATPLFGALIDRVGCRLPMLLGLGGIVLATILFGLSRGLVALVFARALQGVACAATATASLALVASVYPASGLGKAMGLATAGNAAGTLLGPPLGGVLFEYGGPLAPLAFAAVLAAIDGVARATLPFQRHEPGEPIRLVSLLRQRTVMAVGIIVLLGAGSLTLIEATLPLHWAERFQARPMTIGACFAVATIAFGASAPVVGMLEARWGRLRAAVAGLGGLSLTLPMIAVADSLVLSFAGVAALGIAVGLTITPTMPALADAVKSIGGGSYGAAYAIFNGAWALGMLTGPVVGSLLAEVFSFRVALLGATAVTLMAALTLRVQKQSTPAVAPLPP